MPANYTEILETLRELVARERIEFLPLAPDAKPVSSYPPIQKYVLHLKNGAKPESAAEDLFVALCKEVLGVPPTRQVGAGAGWVDFMLPERKGDPLPLELKPLFQRDGTDALWRNDANPKHHASSYAIGTCACALYPNSIAPYPLHSPSYPLQTHTVGSN